MIRFSIALLFLFVHAFAFAQPNNEQGFLTLQLGKSAREAALSGKAFAVNDQDPNIAFFNPALISADAGNAIALNYVNYFSDINFGYAGYQFTTKKLPLAFMAGIQYFSYGSFDRRNEIGQQTGTFSANDFVLKAGASYCIRENWHAGVYAKYFYSAMDSYKSIALASDWSLAYVNDEKGFTASLLLNNVGLVLKQDAETEQKLPFDMQIGMSKKLKNAPFRFHFAYDQMTNWDLSYSQNDDENIDPFTGNVIAAEKSGFGDLFFRHVYAGLELVITKNFHVRMGYNYRRRQELKIEEKPGAVGISWGTEFKINRFKFAYARSTYHQAGPSNQFSISTSLEKFGL